MSEYIAGLRTEPSEFRSIKDDHLDLHRAERELGDVPAAITLDFLRENGACKGVDLDTMFPEGARGVPEAKEICENCPVEDECLEVALSRKEDKGVWGGMSERERRRMLRAQREQNQNQTFES